MICELDKEMIDEFIDNCGVVSEVIRSSELLELHCVSRSEVITGHVLQYAASRGNVLGPTCGVPSAAP